LRKEFANGVFIGSKRQVAHVNLTHNSINSLKIRLIGGLRYQRLRRHESNNRQLSAAAHRKILGV
jgi:hypothetical protein